MLLDMAGCSIHFHLYPDPLIGIWGVKDQPGFNGDGFGDVVVIGHILDNKMSLLFFRYSFENEFKERLDWRLPEGCEEFGINGFVHILSQILKSTIGPYDSTSIPIAFTRFIN